MFKENFVLRTLSLSFLLLILSLSRANAAALTLNCTLPSAQVGIAYNSTCPAAGGTTPYTYSISAGALPTPLTINASTGAITGTPTTAGTTYSFTIKVTDNSANTQTVTQAFTNFVVAPAALTLNCTLPSAQVGVAYNSSCPAAGGTPPYTYSISAGALPTPLSINASTGAITGTPTTAGTYAFTIKATDSTSQTVTHAFSNFVVAPAALTLNCTLPSAQVGVAYNSSCPAAGGTPPYSYSISAGALPTPLAINASTGAITGTPSTAGTYSFTIKATDSASQTITQAFTNFVVAPAVLTLTCTLPSAQVGVAYNSTCPAAGGTPPYTYSISAGALPVPLAINSATGAITGTPTTAGTTYSFTIKVTDSSTTSQTATKAFTNFVVAPAALTLNCTLPAAQVGVAYNSSCPAAGGTPPYTYSISAGALPSPLTINSSTGAITGTPTTAGNTYTFTIKVTDSASQTATQAVTNFVVAPPALTLTCTLPSAQVGVAYNSGCTAAGGTPPYTYSISAGALPTPLTINASTGAITGTPTIAGTAYSFTVRVTDSAATQQMTTQAIANFTVLPSNSPTPPTFTFVGLPSSQTPGTSISGGTISLSTSSIAWPVQVTLGFAANAAGVAATYIDPALQFVDNSGNKLGTVYSVTIPALTNTVPLPEIAPGTVEGNISVKLTVTGQTGAASTISVPASKPIITPGSVQVLNITSTGFDVEVVANSSPRDLKTATFTFNAAAGATISGATTFSVDVTSLMAGWYSSTASQQYGSEFLLTVPFTFSGSSVAISSVTVTLTNSVGQSAAATGTF